MIQNEKLLVTYFGNRILITSGNQNTGKTCNNINHIANRWTASIRDCSKVLKMFGKGEFTVIAGGKHRYSKFLLRSVLIMIYSLIITKITLTGQLRWWRLKRQQGYGILPFKYIIMNDVQLLNFYF